MSIKLFTMKVCPYCIKAKKLLDQRGFKYSEESIDDYSDAQWDELCAKSKMKTVPMIYAGDRLIGGFTELAALDEKDKLESLRA